VLSDPRNPQETRFLASAQLAGGKFLHSVRDQTFRERDDLYLLFVAVDAEQGTFEPVWLVPSVDFAKFTAPSARRRRRFSASAKPESKDQWRPYRLARSELASRLLAVLDVLEAA